MILMKIKTIMLFPDELDLEMHELSLYCCFSDYLMYFFDSENH